MIDDASRCDRLANLLGKLRRHCDTGFALAIHIRLTRPSLMYQTYDATWSDHYSENGYMLCDPVVRFGLTQVGRVRWEDLASEDEAGVLAAARRFGLHNGWALALGSASSRTIAGLTRSDRAHDAGEISEIEALIGEIHALTGDISNWPAFEQARARRLQA